MEQLILIPASIVNNLPAMVRNELGKLSPQKQEEFLEEYRGKAKSIGIAYVLWLLLGWHYIYLRKWGIQILFWLTVNGPGAGGPCRYFNPDFESEPVPRGGGAPGWAGVRGNMQKFSGEGRKKGTGIKPQRRGGRRENEAQSEEKANPPLQPSSTSLGDGCTASFDRVHG